MSNNEEVVSPNAIVTRPAKLELPPATYGTMPHHTLQLVEHLKRQIAFSRGTYGPGPRTAGVVAHIRKEIEEVIKSNGAPTEWVDIVILGLDGLTRAILATGVTTDVAAQTAVNILVEKQNKNERRNWPDWRKAELDVPIEHVRGEHD